MDFGDRTIDYNI
ncbi:hypothetical protein V2J09_006052 [Rumex salicifolius]